MFGKHIRFSKHIRFKKHRVIVSATVRTEHE